MSAPAPILEINLVALARKTGINYTTLYDRYNRGDRGERLTRVVKTHQLELLGTPLVELPALIAKDTGIEPPYHAVLYHFRKLKKTGLEGVELAKALLAHFENRAAEVNGR